MLPVCKYTNNDLLDCMGGFDDVETVVHWENNNRRFVCTDSAGWLSLPGATIVAYSDAIVVAAFTVLAVLCTMLVTVYAPTDAMGIFSRIRRALYKLDALFSNYPPGANPLPIMEGAISGSVIVACLSVFAVVAVNVVFDGTSPSHATITPYMLSSKAHGGYSLMGDLHTRLRFETLVSNCAANDTVGNVFCTADDATFPFRPTSNRTNGVSCQRVHLHGQTFCHLKWSADTKVLSPDTYLSFDMNASLGDITWFRISSFLSAKSLINDDQVPYTLNFSQAAIPFRISSLWNSYVIRRSLVCMLSGCQEQGGQVQLLRRGGVHFQLI
jgi:hypothetical protein